jgi:surface carbohydrate biosynthesis protein (TIGR04326 family)
LTSSSSIPAERLVVVDTDRAVAVEGRCVAYWAQRDAPSGGVSIPAVVEEMAADLRAQYVAWTHDLGATSVAGESIRRHLAFWPDFSFWWMGLIPEKGPLRTGGVYAVFKLRALEHVYQVRACRGVTYVGSNRRLHLVLKRWCRAMGHPYDRRAAPSRREARLSRHPLARRLPSVVQAFGYLSAKCWQRYRVARRKASPVDSAAGRQLTVITYFPNIDLARAREGTFRSRYWEDLHDVLDEAPGRVTWIWLYVDSDQVSYRDAVRMRDSCNATGAAKHRHVLLDELASARVVARALGTYARACASAWRLRSARAAFRMPGSSLNFFPMLASDWYSSLCGVVAMEGALNLELFDAAARQIGRSDSTLFVWENQPWEHAAVVAWRRHGLGPTVGVQHATLPPLDLRAFVDARELAAAPPERRPTPDLLAVNGSGARDLMVRAGFPADRLFMTEALRYSHLSRISPATDAAGPILLVVTGFRRSEALGQLALLAEAADGGALARYRRVLVKPHPFCPVEPLPRGGKSTAPWEIVDEAIGPLLAKADAAFVANSTSAVVEALYLGVPTAVCAPEDDMNLSPAFGWPGVPMVSTAAGLAAFLRAPTAAPWPADYWIVEEALPRWRKLLTA